MPGFLRRRILSGAFALISVVALAATRLEAALEFSGYLSSANESRVVITDLETGKSSSWLTPGQSFQGYKIIGVANNVLTLEYERKRLELPLKTDRVKHGKSPTLPRTPVAVAIGPDGSLSHEGKPVSPEAFDRILRDLAKTGMSLALAVHEPPQPNQTSHQAVQRVMRSLRDSGARHWSLKIVNARALAK